MTNEKMIERGWTREGRGWISPVRHPTPRAGKHDTRVWQYGPTTWACACTGCGFTLVDVDKATAEDAAARHWREDYDVPFRSEVLYTSKGHEVETQMADEAAAEILTGLVGNDFARDLATGFAEYGSWTAKQRPWAHLLANEAANASTTEPAEESTEDAVRFPRIVAMMDAAAAELKYPKVRLADDAGNVVRLSIAGGRARHPGSVNVTTDESYQDNTWYGRIMTDGAWAPGRNAPAWIADALAAFEADPEGAARAYGQRYAHCCFCGRELVESGSVDVGYGPVCAEHWGLPHPQH